MCCRRSRSRGLNSRLRLESPRAVFLLDCDVCLAHLFQQPVLERNRSRLLHQQVADLIFAGEVGLGRLSPLVDLEDMESELALDGIGDGVDLGCHGGVTEGVYVSLRERASQVAAVP